MPPPPLDSAVTQFQVDSALNIERFENATPGDKNWHIGLFEPWSCAYGYPDGQPVYAEVCVNSDHFHIYWLNDGNQAPVILKMNENPMNYQIPPKPTLDAAMGAR